MELRGETGTDRKASSGSFDQWWFWIIMLPSEIKTKTLGRNSGSVEFLFHIYFTGWNIVFHNSPGEIFLKNASVKNKIKRFSPNLISHVSKNAPHLCSGACVLQEFRRCRRRITSNVDQFPGMGREVLAPDLGTATFTARDWGHDTFLKANQWTVMGKTAKTGKRKTNVSTGNRQCCISKLWRMSRIWGCSRVAELNTEI